MMIVSNVEECNQLKTCIKEKEKKKEKRDSCYFSFCFAKIVADNELIFHIFSVSRILFKSFKLDLKKK